MFLSANAVPSGSVIALFFGLAVFLSVEDIHLKFLSLPDHNPPLSGEFFVISLGKGISDYKKEPFSGSFRLAFFLVFCRSRRCLPVGAV